MRDIRDAKLMAKALRQGLQAHNVELSHAACLELTAQQFGYANWNILAARLVSPAASKLIVPEGWLVRGSAPEAYEMGVDPAVPESPACIRRAAGEPAPNAKEFGTLMQSFAATAWRSKNLRLRAELKAEAVTGAATIWMRVDGIPGARYLRFDNMAQRREDGALRGNSDWVVREIILDVPQEAESIHFGFFLRGTGQCWARHFTLSDAGDDASARRYPEQPSNLF
jgi:hypothetical protein